MDPKLITVGVELEMILENISDEEDVIYQYSITADALKPLTEEFGIPVTNSCSGDDLISDDASEPMAIVEVFETFNVQQDETIGEYDGTRGVEVATPILRNNAWKKVIPVFCKAMKGLSPFFDDTTGLHIHVGIGKAYSLLQLKQISKAIILFEKQMDTCHPANRRQDNTLDIFNSIRSNRKNRVFKSKSTLQCIEMIDTAGSLKELFKMINCHEAACFHDNPERSYKYNLMSPYETIEFRQGIATVDADEILMWIERVVKFVGSAISTSDADFKTWAISAVVPSLVYERFGVPAPA